MFISPDGRTFPTTQDAYAAGVDVRSLKPATQTQAQEEVHLHACIVGFDDQDDADVVTYSGSGIAVSWYESDSFAVEVEAWLSARGDKVRLHRFEKAVSREGALELGSAVSKIPGHLQPVPATAPAEKATPIVQAAPVPAPRRDVIDVAPVPATPRREVIVAPSHVMAVTGAEVTDPGTGIAIPERMLASRSMPRGKLQTFHLEEVRDTLRARRDKQNPRDIERSAAQLHVDWRKEGRVTAQFMGPRGLEGDTYQFTRHGLAQLSREVLPSHGLGFLEDMLPLPKGRELATVNWSLFRNEASSARMFRAIDTKTGPTIRAVMSQSYAPFDNLEAVELLLNTVQLAQLPVLSHHETDGGFRLRFALKGREEITLKEPTPMLEVWNSEVGSRSFGLVSGMFKLICTNGMGSWEADSKWTWRHMGDSERIRSGVVSALTEVQTSAAGVVDAYNRAVGVAIDDAIAWMEASLEGILPMDQVKQATKALTHETTTPGGTLASVVDALTLTAQDLRGLDAMHGMEQAAAQLLRKGLSQSLRHDGRILA